MVQLKGVGVPDVDVIGHNSVWITNSVGLIVYLFVSISETINYDN